MKHILFTLAVMLTGFSFNSISAQSFTKQYSDYTYFNYYYNKTIPTSDYGFISAWNRYDTVYPFSAGMFLMKANVDGDTMWTSNISSGDSGFTEMHDFIVVDDTNYLVTGYWMYNLPGNDTEGIALIKLGQNGNIIWNRLFMLTDTANFLGNEYSNHIIEAVDGGYILSGSHDDSCMCRVYSTLIKVDDNGQVLWSNSFDGTGNEEIISTSDSCYLLRGFYPATDSTVITKCDKSGSVIWRKNFYIGTNNDYVQTNGLVKNESGGAYVSMFDCIVDLNGSGDTLWTKYLPESTYFQYSYLTSSNDHKLILLGSKPSALLSYGLIKLDTTGHFEFCNTVSNSYIGFPRTIHHTADSKYLIFLSLGNDPVFLKGDSTLFTLCVIAGPVSIRYRSISQGK
jgi:hypothetical protein